NPPPASNGTVAIGAGNLRLDSEDLDRNGILDPGNPLVGGNLGYTATDSSQHFGFDLGATAATDPDAVDFSGWKFVHVPLNISSSTAASWTAVKELRLSFLAGSGAQRTGRIRIGKISIVGNRWQVDNVDVVGSTLTVSPINNEDNS